MSSIGIFDWNPSNLLESDLLLMDFATISDVAHTDIGVACWTQPSFVAAGNSEEIGQSAHKGLSQDVSRHRMLLEPPQMPISHSRCVDMDEGLQQ